MIISLLPIILYHNNLNKV